MVMATYEPINSTPSIWFPGTEDKSTRAIPFQLANLPMHIPTFFTFAKKGPLEARYVNGGTAVDLFGSEIFDTTSPYATIVTPFLRLSNRLANPMIIQRVIPESAAKEANIILALEVLETENYYESKYKTGDRRREIDKDARIVKADDIPERGVYLQWRVYHVETSKGRAGEIRDWESAWEKIDKDNRLRAVDSKEVSTVYPVFGAKARWIGEYANNIGFSIYNDNTDLAPLFTRAEKACLYRFEVVERDNPMSNSYNVPTVNGENSVRFSFKENATNPRASNVSLDIQEILMDNYQQRQLGNRPAVDGPFSEIHVFREQLEEALMKCLSVEVAYNTDQHERSPSVDFAHLKPTSTTDELFEYCHLINIVDGKDSQGRPYNRIFVRNQLGNPGVLTGESNIALGKENRHFLAGGYDGFDPKERNVKKLSKIYDEIVRNQFRNFGSLESKFLDMGRYPLRQFYDVGFTIETKQQMIRLLGKRQDVNLTLSTVDLVNADASTKEAIEEASIGASLYSLLSGYLESEEFSTGVKRANIIASDMRPNDVGRYRKRVPMTYQIFAMRSNYMNNATGMAEGLGYDAPPYNHVTEGYDVSNTYASDTVRQLSYWANGITYFIHKTDNLVFCPAVRTVYSKETSVLTSDITMQIVCDINYITFQVWTELVGNSKLSDAEFIKASNKMIEDRVRARYDNRVVVVVDTFKSLTDQAKGYAWSTNTKLYANNMRTVNKSWVTTYRMEDLNG